MKELLLTILGFLVPVIALGDPSQTTAYLMSEPASLFDIGMLQLNAAISTSSHETGKKEHIEPGSAFYDFDHDKITVVEGVHTKFVKDADAKQTCVDIINGIRNLAGMYPVESATLINKHSLLSIFFVHGGYSHKTGPTDDDVQSHIDQTIELVGYVRHWDSAKMQDRLLTKCKADLLSKDIYFTNSED